MSKINWDEMLAGSFIKLENAEAKTMKCKNWKPQTQFKDDKTGGIRPGICLDVLAEDNFTYTEETKKTWTITAKGAMGLLKPIIQKAEAMDEEYINIVVVRVGEGKNTTYSIKEKKVEPVIDDTITTKEEVVTEDA